MRFLKVILWLVLTVAFLILMALFVVYGAPSIQDKFPMGKGSSGEAMQNDAGGKKVLSLINKDIQKLNVKYAGYTTGQSYIVINTTDNKFFLYNNKKLVRKGFCSSGSYTRLETESHKQWVFKTPKGKYKIKSKITNPVWKRPDWSFVEEGLPIPSANDDSRFEYGVLGNYALALGDGYMIHGTIYKRFLGMPVTHGCVRLNDDDLEVIYNTLNIGSKVYIF
jgi:lipoprotein-anchoring transpeptidase ErfK/SrfK